jgi:hypothetical protein
MALLYVDRQEELGISIVRQSTWEMSCARRCRFATSNARALAALPFRSLRCPAEHAHDRAGDTPPFAFLAPELAAAGRGQRVEARAAVVVRRAPFGVDPAARLQALQRRIERSVIDDEYVAGRLLNRTGNGLAVRRLASVRRMRRSSVPCR